MSASQPETLFEQLFFSTVRVVNNQLDGGESTGTGFIYAVPTSESESAHFLVTNKHVVENAKSLSLHFVRADKGGMPSLGKIYQLNITGLTPNPFQPHPEPDIDVTVMPMQAAIQTAMTDGAPVFFKSIPSDAVPSLAQLAELDAVENVRFVGYPAGLFDSENFLPVMRRGTTASYLQHDYENRPTFLIDASVFPGSSGSPVFIADNGWYSTRSGVVMGSRVFLLGIVAAVHTSERAGRLVDTRGFGTVQVPMVKEMIDLGVVYKARTIDECVDLVLAAHSLTRWDKSSASEPTAAEADALSARID